jgi:hypothetical protein
LDSTKNAFSFSEQTASNDFTSEEKDLSEVKSLLAVCSEKEKAFLVESNHLPISIV